MGTRITLAQAEVSEIYCSFYVHFVCQLLNFLVTMPVAMLIIWLFFSMCAINHIAGVLICFKCC